MGKTFLGKYDDPGNPTVAVHIGSTQIPNILVDLGVAINVMTIETIIKLRLANIRPTPTVLELADRSTIKPEGILDDLIILVDSWEYPTEFLVLQPKPQLGEHPLILGRTWLATVDSCISYRSGSMTILDGTETKNITLYPIARLSLEAETTLWMELDEEEEVQPL